MTQNRSHRQSYSQSTTKIGPWRQCLAQHAARFAQLLHTNFAPWRHAWLSVDPYSIRIRFWRKTWIWLLRTRIFTPSRYEHYTSTSTYEQPRQRFQNDLEDSGQKIQWLCDSTVRKLISLQETLSDDLKSWMVHCWRVLEIIILMMFKWFSFWWIKSSKRIEPSCKKIFAI